MQQSVIRIIVASVVTLLSLATLAGVAGAHRNDESYLYLDVGDNDLRGSIQMPYGDVRDVLGLTLVGTADEVSAEIADNLDVLQAVARDHTRVGPEADPWTLTFDGFDVLIDEKVDENGLGYVILPFVVDYPGAEVPQIMDVEFTVFLDEIDDRNNIALISNDWKRGVIDQEANELVIFTTSARTGTIDLGDPGSEWNNFRSSIDLGVDHIRTGPDHIFFVVVLLLPSVLVLSGMTWRAGPSFKGSLWRVLKVATMFTVAHSITFTLAGLDLLPLPPSKLVETIIAASIAAAALHNFRPILGHREWSIAFLFGLFHGMGFAGLVEDLQVSRTTQLVSLLGRNVGIEIGQAIIILISFPALFILSRTRFYKPFFNLATLALAGVSTIWVFERTLETNYGIDWFVNRIIAWPRSLVVCFAFTGLAALLYRNEKASGRLVELPKETTDESEPRAVGAAVG